MGCLLSFRFLGTFHTHSWDVTGTAVSSSSEESNGSGVTLLGVSPASAWSRAETWVQLADFLLVEQYWHIKFYTSVGDQRSNVITCCICNTWRKFRLNINRITHPAAHWQVASMMFVSGLFFFSSKPTLYDTGFIDAFVIARTWQYSGLLIFTSILANRPDAQWP